MASQLFILAVILMSVQQIYSQEDFLKLKLPKAAHKDFDRDWFPTTQDWVRKNYVKDSIEENRKLVAFTNALESALKEKLQNIKHNMTQETFAEMQKNGTIDPQVISFYLPKISRNSNSNHYLVLVLLDVC